MRKPEDFTEYPEAIMSNFDHSIDHIVAGKIKDKPLYAQYAGWNFCGYVWWQDDMWHCEIMTHGHYQETFTDDTLADIMKRVCYEYGND